MLSLIELFVASHTKQFNRRSLQKPKTIRYPSLMNLEAGEKLATSHQIAEFIRPKCPRDHTLLVHADRLLQSQQRNE